MDGAGQGKKDETTALFWQSKQNILTIHRRPYIVEVDPVTSYHSQKELGHNDEVQRSEIGHS